jgi:eukaryotic-like serine/threonine-protein kinase
MFSFRALGTISLAAEDGVEIRSVLAQPKRVALLAYVASPETPEFVARETLMGLFWPDRDAAHARRALRSSLYFLRRSLGSGVLIARGEHEVGIDPAHLWCDVGALEDALESSHFEEAVHLYEGEYLPGLAVAGVPDFEMWLEAERRRLRRRTREAALQLARTAVANEDAHEAEEWARRGLALDPFDEEALRLLLEILAGRGNGAQALQVYEAFAQSLRSELELEPSARTQEVAARLREPPPQGVSAALLASEPAGSSTVVAHASESETSWAGALRIGVFFAFATTVVLAGVHGLMIGLGLPGWVFFGAVGLMAAGLPVMLLTQRQERSRTLARAAGLRPPTPTGVKRLFTWRGAILGGGAAFAVLGVAVAAAMAARALGIGPFATLESSGALHERQTVILADFIDHTADSTLGTALTEAFRVDLSQSPAVRLLSREAIEGTLQRMERSAGTRLTPRVAREVAERAGVAAVIGGRIDAVGPGYALSASVVAVESGDVLTAVRATAADDRHLIGAAEKLSHELRGRIGESLVSIRRTPPLEHVTTASLEALRDYTLASRELNRRNDDKGIGLMREAIRHDTAFAMAYRRLSAGLYDSGSGPEEQLAAARAAVRHSNRLDDYERWHAEAWLAWIAGRYEDARRKYETLLSAYPDDDLALADLAGVYVSLGQLGEADSLYQRTITIGAPFRVTYGNLMHVQLAEGKVGEAQRSLDALRRAFPGAALDAVLWMGTATQDYAAVSQAAQQVNGASGVMAMAANLEGRPAPAREQYILAARQAEQQGRMHLALAMRLNLPLMDAGLLQDTTMAGRDVDGALQSDALDVGLPGDRPYLLLAWADAWAGRTRKASDVLSQYDRLVAEDLRRSWQPFESYVRGVIAMQDGRPAAALGLLRRAQGQLACDACYGITVGRVQEMLGRPDSAIIAYERYTANIPAVMLLTRGGPTWGMLAPAEERLAQLYEQRGDTVRAVQHFRAFIGLWKDAGPELRPRVEEARRRMGLLLAGG